MNERFESASISANIDIFELMNSVLLDEQGRQIPMPFLWQTNPAIFVYLRHFACAACRAHAEQPQA